MAGQFTHEIIIDDYESFCDWIESWSKGDEKPPVYIRELKNKLGGIIRIRGYEDDDVIKYIDLPPMETPHILLPHPKDFDRKPPANYSPDDFYTDGTTFKEVECEGETYMKFDQTHFTNNKDKYRRSVIAAYCTRKCY